MDYTKCYPKDEGKNQTSIIKNLMISYKIQRAWWEEECFLGEKTVEKHRKNGLSDFGLKVGSFLIKSFLNFFLN